MENKQSKPSWKLNIFDIIIIAVVIIAAGALIFLWRFSGKSSATVNYKPVHYTIELNSMRGDSAEKIKEGDTIMDSTKKFIMGTVVSVSVGPAKIAETNLETGDIVLSELPNQETATVTLVCNCSASDSQISAESGYLVRIGTEVSAAGPGYAGRGYIVAIQREDLEQ
jgi:hypothetical protein